jgi:glycosyltransferase involved in cell wall biosynthesis
LFPNSVDYKHGFTQQQLAAVYSTADVVLTTSYGEGFGLATIEAQACGTRVIASNWAASKDLAGPDSWLVDGQPFWDEAQVAWFQIPSIPSIVNALKEAYQQSQEEGRHSEASRQFALDFDVEKVWDEKWVPFLKEHLK